MDICNDNDTIGLDVNNGLMVLPLLEEKTQEGVENKR
jgi:hypothetical protein